MIITRHLKAELRSGIGKFDVVVVIGPHVFAPSPPRYVLNSNSEPGGEFEGQSLLISSSPRVINVEYYDFIPESLPDLAEQDSKNIKTLPYLKKFPKFNSSVDLKTKSYRTNNLKLEFTNHKYNGKTLTERLNKINPINQICSVYLVSDSTFSIGNTSSNINVAGTITQQRISRYEHNKDTVTLVLEDLTEAHLKQEVLRDADIPAGYKFPTEGIYRSNQRGKYSPIVYGDFGEDMLPFNLDEEFVLRVDRYWDNSFSDNMPTIDTQYINQPTQEQEISWVYLLDNESFAYTQIPQYGVDDGIDVPDVIDMDNATQYYYVEVGLINGPGIQLFSFSRTLSETYFGSGEYDLNADQLQQLSLGIYQVLPTVQFANLIQRSDTVLDPNEQREEGHPSIQKPYKFSYSYQNYWTDIRQDDVELLESEWEQNKKIKWDGPLNFSMSYMGPTLKGTYSGLSTSLLGTVEMLNQAYGSGASTATCERKGYSVIVPIAGLANSLANGVRVKYKIRIGNIGPEYQSNPILTDIDTMVSDGLSLTGVNPYMKSGYFSDGFNSNISGNPFPNRSIRFGMRGINPTDYTEYEGRDIYYDYGNPEQNTSGGEAWYAHYENLLDLTLSGSYVGSGESPVFEEGGGVFTDASPSFASANYEGEYIYSVNKFLHSWVQQPWPALEIELTPMHWGQGELIHLGNPSQMEDFLQNQFGDSFTDSDLTVYSFGVLQLANTQKPESVWNISQAVEIELFDFEIEAVAYLSGVHTKQFYCNKVSGRKTVSPDDNHPINQIRDIQHNEIIGEHIPNNVIDYIRYIDLDTFSTYAASNNYQTRIYLDKPTEFGKLMSDIFKNTEYFYYYTEVNTLKIDYISHSYSSTDATYTFKKGDIKSVSFSRTPVEDVCLEVNLKYRYEPGRKIYLAETGYLGFDEVFEYTDTNIYGNLNDESREIYRKTIDSKYCADEQTALLERQNYLMWNYNQHNIVDLVLPQKYIDVKVGDTFVFYDLDTIDNYRPYGENITLTGLSEEGPVIRNGQQIFPTFLVISTSFDIETNKVKAIQMHDMTFEQDAVEIYGCTNPVANNYNPAATVNDGSCQFDIYGCTDPSALNYNPLATADDDTCSYGPGAIIGCTDPSAENYNPLASQDDGSCVYPAPNKGSLDTFSNDRHMLVEESPFGGGVSNYGFDFGTGIPLVPALDINYDQTVMLDEAQSLLSEVLSAPEINYNDPVIKQLDTDWSYELNEEDLSNMIDIILFALGLNFDPSPSDLYLFTQADYFDHRPDNYIPIGKGTAYISNWVASNGVHPSNTKTRPGNTNPISYNYKDNDEINKAFQIPIPFRAKDSFVAIIQDLIAQQGYDSYEELYGLIFEGRKGTPIRTCITVRTTEPFYIKEEIYTINEEGENTWTYFPPPPYNPEYANPDKYKRLDNMVTVSKQSFYSTDRNPSNYYSSSADPANDMAINLFGQHPFDDEYKFNDGDENSPYTLIWLKIDPKFYTAESGIQIDNEHNFGAYEANVSGGHLNILYRELGDAATDAQAYYDSLEVQDAGYLYKLTFRGAESGQTFVRYYAVTYHADYWGCSYGQFFEFINNEIVPPPPPPDANWAGVIEADLEGYGTGTPLSDNWTPIDGE